MKATASGCKTPPAPGPIAKKKKEFKTVAIKYVFRNFAWDPFYNKFFPEWFRLLVAKILCFTRTSPLYSWVACSVNNIKVLNIVSGETSVWGAAFGYLMKSRRGSKDTSLELGIKVPSDGQINVTTVGAALLNASGLLGQYMLNNSAFKNATSVETGPIMIKTPPPTPSTPTPAKKSTRAPPMVGPFSASVFGAMVVGIATLLGASAIGVVCLIQKKKAAARAEKVAPATEEGVDMANIKLQSTYTTETSRRQTTFAGEHTDDYHDAPGYEENEAGEEEGTPYAGQYVVYETAVEAKVNAFSSEDWCS